MSSPNPFVSAAAAELVARVERRFVPLPSTSSRAAIALRFIGSAALGAGVYGLWLARDTVPAAAALLLGGVVAIVAAPFVSRKSAPPVRVGELGVMLGDPPEARRAHWCDIEELRVAGDELRLQTPEGPLAVPLVSHGRAAARILAEAALRIPARVDVAPKAHERLPSLSDADGELVPAARLQLAGRKCSASGKSITFESDARLCSNCAALYHVSHAPAQCLRCQRPLGGGRVPSSTLATGQRG